MFARIIRARATRLAAAAGLTATIVTGGVAASVTEASTPTGATISDTSTSTTWTGGPFLVPNVTAQAGSPVCTAPTSCDDFALRVQTPAGYGDTHQLNIQVSWPTSA